MRKADRETSIEDAILEINTPSPTGTEVYHR
jgi:hypothetical protein